MARWWQPWSRRDELEQARHDRERIEARLRPLVADLAAHVERLERFLEDAPEGQRGE